MPQFQAIDPVSADFLVVFTVGTREQGAVGERDAEEARVILMQAI